MTKALVVGSEQVGPFADHLGNLVNGLAPNVGTLVSKLLKKAAESGANSENDTQAMSTALQAAPMFAVDLKKIGFPSDTQSITAHLQSAFDALKHMPVIKAAAAAADDPADSEKPDKQDTVKHVPRSK